MNRKKRLFLGGLLVILWAGGFLFLKPALIWTGFGKKPVFFFNLILLTCIFIIFFSELIYLTIKLIFRLKISLTKKICATYLFHTAILSIFFISGGMDRLILEVGSKTTWAVLIPVMLFMAIATSLSISAMLTAPLKQLSCAVQKIREGDYTQELNILTQDELNDLATSFNQMTREIRQFNDSNIAKLLAEKTKAAALLYSIGDGLLMTDFSGNIMLMNQQSANFLNLQDKTGQSANIAGLPSLSVLYSAIEEVKLHPSSTVCRTFAFGGEEDEEGHKILKTETSIVRTDTGENIGLVTVLHDITAEKNLEKMKDDFIHSITHDLRNPVTSMLGFLDILLSDTAKSLSEQQKKYLGVMNSSANWLLSLVNNMLDIARFDSGNPVKLEKAEFDLKTMLDKIEESMFPIAQRNEIILTVKYPATLSPLLADQEQIKRVIINLTDNAIKFTPSGGKVEILAGEKDTAFQISVSDTGKGVPENMQGKIFEKYQQGSSIRQKGTGLGLTISKLIVEAHNGSIRVESKPGQGSRFVIELPKL